MATRYYLNNVAAPYTPATLRGAWDNTASAVTKRIDTSKVGSSAAANVSANGSTPLPWDVLCYRGVSGPLAAQTISGNLSGVINSSEFTATANVVLHVHVYVTTGDSDTPRGTLLTDFIDSVEIPQDGSFNTRGGALSSAALSSLAISSGDRLVVEIGLTYPVGSTGSLAFLTYGGDISAPDAHVDASSPGSATSASWIEFDTDLTYNTIALQVSQTVAEAAVKTSADPALYVSQTVAEVLAAPSTTALYVSQTVAEVLVGRPTTKLYLTNDPSFIYSPATFKGAWDDTSNAVTHHLHTSRKGDGTRVDGVEINVAAAWDVLLYRGVSLPIKTAVTIAGTLDFIYQAIESNAAADDFLHLHIWVTQGDSDTVRGTLLNDYIDATEWPAGGVGQVTGVINPQQTLSSVSALVGDRIVVEIGYRAQNTVTTSRTGSLHYGNYLTDATGNEVNVSPTSGTTGAPYLVFGTAIAFKETILYLTSGTAPATPAAVRGTWTDTSQMVTKALSTSKSGVKSSSVQSETSLTQYDTLLYRGVSDELAAQTIDSQGVVFTSPVQETNLAADVYAYLHFYVMKSDGTVRGTLAADQELAIEADTANYQMKTITIGSPLAVSSGDRLVLELGARFKNVDATNRTARSYYGGSIGDAAADTSLTPEESGWMHFSQTILWIGDAVPIVGRSFAVFVG